METFQFESFVLDRNAYELRCDGQVVRLERMPMELLFLLVERRGQLVTRQDILDRLYGREVVGDVDNSINTAIRKIRQALKERTDEPRFLFTVAGKGYRFAVPPTNEPSAVVVTAEPEHAPSINQPISHYKRSGLWIALATMAVVAGITLTFGHEIRARFFDPHPSKVMLAVLPFKNLSGDPQQEYFADGMTEEMIAQLGGLDPQHLGVIARTSMMLYKGENKDLTQVAKELGVQYLLESSVRFDNDHVRVTAQLIQASDQTHLWAESFNGDLSDTLKIQSDLARFIASKIGLTLSQQTQRSLAGTPIVNPEAHKAYLQGLQGWNMKTRAGFEQGIAAYNRAISIDPNYAAAYAGLAQIYLLAGRSGVSTIAMSKAREAAMHALTLDSKQALAHSVLGFISAHYDFDWRTAQREFLLGITLNSSNAAGHMFYANSYLGPMGQIDEAIAEAKLAIQLDPLSASLQAFLGQIYIWARRYDDALAQYQKVARMSPGFVVAHYNLSDYYEKVENFENAITERSTAWILNGADLSEVTQMATALRNGFATAGARGYWQARAKLHNPTGQELFRAEAFDIAMIYARLGDKDTALTWIERGYADKSLPMIEIDLEPDFDSLRNEPRFQEIRKRMGFAK